MRERLGIQLGVILLSIAAVVCGVASAETDSKTKAADVEPASVDVSSPAESAPAPSAPLPTPTAEAAKPKAPEEEVKMQLSGTRWAIELTPLTAAEKAKPKKDTVKFEGGQVSSDWLVKAGYPQTNYTLTIGGDGVPVWETMQTKEGAGVVFWRGELHGSIMRGVLSKHPVEGAPEDFSFVGRESGGKAVGSESQPSSEAIRTTTGTDVSTPSAQEESPKKKKKRKGLFGR